MYISVSSKLCAIRVRAVFPSGLLSMMHIDILSIDVYSCNIVSRYGASMCAYAGMVFNATF